MPQAVIIAVADERHNARRERLSGEIRQIPPSPPRPALQRAGRPRFNTLPNDLVVPPIRAAHQPLDVGVHLYRVRRPAQQAGPLSASLSHRPQVGLNVEAVECRMVQFLGWGPHRCTRQTVPAARGPLSLVLRERFPGEPILRLLAGLCRTRKSHLAGNSTRVSFWQANG